MMPAEASSATDGAAFRLLVAAHFVLAGRVGGAEQMLYNLVRGMAELPVQTTILCASAERLAGGFRDEIAASPRLRLQEIGGGGPRFLAEQRACLDGALAADAILFPNYYLPPLTPARLGRTGIVLHDLQYRHFPAYFSAKKRAWLAAAQRSALRLGLAPGRDAP